MTSIADDIRFGPAVPDRPAIAPSRDAQLVGRHITIVAVHPDHAASLYSLIKGPEQHSLFDYLFDEPPDSLASLQHQLEEKATMTNPWAYSILLHVNPDDTPKAVGMASLMRMDLPNRVIEVGSILFTPALQRTPAATEAMYLLARYVFEDLGFRRYEWKCNSLNAPSRRAAERLGFTYEGTFRQHMIARGHNRDTTWFAMLDSEWPRLKGGFEAWMDPSNFDQNGRQKRKLEDLRLA
ncbi:acyl-CoA N-acyltransferase [Didymella exigua CBS 183.55]|uniref:Acyl-CoA N-acyltransferase n=1 Tax=Didymella exigua CBS 183.55 TaxID=1150837 RepID=A0A6A5R7W8_9PLEO|nr:acyl-CoA N-acyltransferase [Didymella exigua CBS 183.55]KAF1923429.1 acyl-CoA N-acyltransferase [Didymella exigua CBS 183.55]